MMRIKNLKYNKIEKKANKYLQIILMLMFEITHCECVKNTALKYIFS
jgi:hypothetical protein